MEICDITLLPKKLQVKKRGENEKKMNTALKIMIIVCIHLHILTDLYHKHKKGKKEKYEENEKIQKNTKQKVPQC